MKKLHFGTDGIRGNADKFPFRNDDLSQLAHALVFWAQEKYRTKNFTKKIIIGHDTRESCTRIKKIVSDIFSSHRIDVIDAGILPTPALLTLLQNSQEYLFGIIISASHNAYTDNGIKLFDAEKGKLSADDEKRIVSLFENRTNYQAPEKITSEQDHTKREASLSSERYIKIIQSFFPKNFLEEKKIILDCAHGATYKVAPLIFSSFGADVITLHDQPNGKNINEHCGALHPQKLQERVVAEKAFAGFGFDGDGDRVVAVNKAGEIKNGDDILALLLSHPFYQNQTTIVGTIMTNKGFEDHLVEKGKKLIRTNVGDKYIAQYLQTHDLLLGGENSGHIIAQDYLPSGDGIFVALRLLDALSKTDNEEMKTFKHYPQILLNVVVEKKEDLHEQPFAHIIAAQKDFLAQGRIIVRYSGTENVLRIMTEDYEQSRAYSAAQTLATELRNALE